MKLHKVKPIVIYSLPLAIVKKFLGRCDKFAHIYGISPGLELNFADNVFRATILFGKSCGEYRMSTPATEGILGETESNP
ncbi:hypothetical protein [Microcystis aeruginosa]|uniref:Uncharacterized protein n=1 Tax=Microcystis aeruginosa NIES-2521 TaxID=2303983 RepID=A0A5A5RNQ3_MICAE|nr:hypothetical protein [Microcystis aeruginosa]GCA78184.1 hypothetical protein MiTs_00162 [Microcystis aeruginosa NIES-2521]